MSESQFRTTRRQKFLTEKYFQLNEQTLEYVIKETLLALPQHKAEGKLDSVGEGGLFEYKLKVLRLRYTAGLPVDSLGSTFDEASAWFDAWHVEYGVYVQDLAKRSGEFLRLDGTPVHLEDLYQFQLVLDFVSLGILLGFGDKVRRAAGWLSRYRNTDMLLESLWEVVVSDPNTEVTEFFHEEPYGLLLDAIYTAETPEQASAYVKKYLDGWYKAFEGVPWHNGHLVQTPEYSNYEGYWAFEAAAVCVIHGIDDSSFRDHMVYPKDLADWAREHKVLDKIKPAAGSKALQLRCEAGQPCPRTGHWFTPAKQDSTRLFSEGEKMPAIKDSPWGSTVWYWAGNQD